MEAEYKIYLINEHNTSCKCHNCHEYLKNPTVHTFNRINNTNKDENKLSYVKCYKQVHGLKCCTNTSCLSHRTSYSPSKKIFNRDNNAVKNMKYIIDYTLKHHERPPEYCRSNISE